MNTNGLKKSEKSSKIKPDKKNDLDPHTSEPSPPDEIQEHLNQISMDPWFFIYSNYVNPRNKK